MSLNIDLLQKGMDATEIRSGKGVVKLVMDPRTSQEAARLMGLETITTLLGVPVEVKDECPPGYVYFM